MKRPLHEVCNTCSPTPPLSKLPLRDITEWDGKKHMRPLGPANRSIDPYPDKPLKPKTLVRAVREHRIKQELIWRVERKRKQTQKSTIKQNQIARFALVAPTLADLKREITHASVTSAPSSKAPPAAKAFQEFYRPILQRINKQIKIWAREGKRWGADGEEERKLRVSRPRRTVDAQQTKLNAIPQEIRWQDWLTEGDIRLLKQESRKYIPAKGVRYREPGYLKAVRFEE